MSRSHSVDLLFAKDKPIIFAFHEYVRTFGPDDLDSRLRTLFHAGLNRPGLRLIVARTPCDYPAQ